MQPFAGLALAFATAADDSPTAPEDWLIPKVVVDANDLVQICDPYDFEANRDLCPPGSSVRNLRPGEAVPYYKTGQWGVRHDSYPIHDRGGNLMIVDSMSWPDISPGIQNIIGGYDIYLVRDGWASASILKDPSGFGTTFFGQLPGHTTPTPYNGWVLFPSFFTSGGYLPGSINAPIMGCYWEQKGQPWPGKPGPLYNYSETSWKYIPGCLYGELGQPKSLDTIQVVHGYISPENDPVGSNTNMAIGHLETFYFTWLYGRTRWESWKAIGDDFGVYHFSDTNASYHDEMFGNGDEWSKLREVAIGVAKYYAPMASANQYYWKNDPNSFIYTEYKGSDGKLRRYALIAVDDFSKVTLTQPQLPPAFPIPERNLLDNPHFDSIDIYGNDTPTPWQIGGTPMPAFALWTSRTPLDIAFTDYATDVGVRYMAFN